MAKTPHILLLYTGGTIGMIRDFDTGILRPFNFDKLLMQIPELKHLDCKISSVSFEEPIDSSNMNPAHWSVICDRIQERYNDFDGFVVLHGSDTMAYTASAISFMFENLSKPVIFTGSQLPIGYIRTDAKENLITSIEIAATQKNGRPIVSEVCLYFEYKLYRANRTTKISSQHFNAFISPNMDPLAESGVDLSFNQYLLLKHRKSCDLKVSRQLSENIVVLKLFPGITEQVVKNVLSIEKLEGVILETFGAGNSPTNLWFQKHLKEALKKGVKIVNVTQCIEGGVQMGRYETSEHLKSLGLIDGKNITTEAAIAKLMYLLAKDLSEIEFKSLFETSLRGEIDE
ncbi:asparaginase [Urechidicola sp. KH5]